MLRRLGLAPTSRRLWIDSVCVDQANDDDKDSQVKQLGTIYRNATRTIIWLGEEDKTTDAAFDMLRTLCTIVSDLRAEHNDSTLLTFEDLRSQGLPNAHDKRWKPFESLLHKPWFTRAWILQEVTLARESWVFCGSHVIGWHEIARVVFALRQGNVDTLFNMEFNLAWRVAYFQIEYLKSTNATLLNLLYLSQFTNATEAKDRVFGIFGLASDQEARDVLDQEACEYSGKHAAEYSFTATAKHYLQRGRLEVLNFASDPSLRNVQLPSWVPDWSTDAPAIDLIAYLYPFEAFNSTVVRRSPTVDPRVLEDDKTLVVPGLITDEIRTVSMHASALGIDTHGRIRSPAVLLVFEHRRHLASKLRSYPTEETVYRKCSQAHWFLDKLSQNQTRATLAYTATYAKNLGLHIKFESQPTYSPAELESYTRWMVYGTEKRNFFFTKNGYMGLGPCFIRPGDKVAHFDGGATPFTIRKTNDASYTLVGDAPFAESWILSSRTKPW